MKILHVIPKFTINKKFTVIGGAASSLLNLSMQQKRTGDEVSVLSHFPLIDKDDKAFLQTTGFVNINISARQNSRLYGAEFTIKSILSALVTGRHCDIIHGHSGYIDYLLASLLIARLAGRQLVYSLYCPVNLDNSITSYPLREKFLRAVTKNVTFIAMSRNIADSLEQVASGNSITVIPPAVNIQKFSDKFDRDAIRKRYSLDEDQPVLLFVGNFSRAKNMECVLLAFKKFLNKYPDARLIVTTELHIQRFSEREKYLGKLIDDLELGENLVSMGIIDNMAELMQMADVLIAPFRDTDGPSDYYLAALEAMAVGTPVFVSPVGGMREVVNESNGRFIDPEQPDLLCAKLEQLFADRSNGKRMGRNAAKYIRENFAPVLVERKVKEVYLEVLKNAG